MATNELRAWYKEIDGTLRALISDVEQNVSLDDFQRREIARLFVYTLVPPKGDNIPFVRALITTIDMRYPEETYWEYLRRRRIEKLNIENSSMFGEIPF